MLPKRIFFTGVPGSRWSGIAQILETIPGFNTSDRTPERTYKHHSYTGHVGAYFGRQMEFEPLIQASGEEYIDQAWKEPGGCRLVKSHQWPDKFAEIEQHYPTIGSCWCIGRIWPVLLGGTKQVAFKLNILVTNGTKTKQTCFTKLPETTN